MLKKLAAHIYQSTQSGRAFFYAKGLAKSNQLNTKVVCIGNLAAGGTGKTPMVMYLAKLLGNAGKHVVILSRGYKGTYEHSSAIVSDTQKIFLSPKDAGDEPYLLALRLSGVPVIVGKNRYANGLLAQHVFKPDVILLDDGFQHLQLKRDLNLVLLDAQNPLAGGVIPQGLLREGPKALKRADAVIFTRSAKPNLVQVNTITTYLKPNTPCFFTQHKPYFYLVPKDADLCKVFVNPSFAEDLPQQKAFVFAGLAKNAAFVDSLKDLGLDIIGTKYFADHYAYTTQDLSEIAQAAVACGAELLVTTEKDHAKLSGKAPMPMAVFGVEINFGDKDQDFAHWLLTTLWR